MKKFVTLILVALMAFGICAAASAEARDSDYFNSYGVTLSAPGSGKINITFSCSSVGTASQLGVSTYNIYRYDDGIWALVSGPNSGSYGYNTSSHAFSKTFSGVSGEKYKVTCTFLSTINNSTETKAYTSRTITAN